MAFFAFSFPAWGQNQTMGRENYLTWDEFLEHYLFDKDTDDAEGERQHLLELEKLEELHQQPLNINTAAREDLLKLPFLNEVQVDSILSYRTKKRLLLSLGELQWIDVLPYATRRVLSLFVYAGDTLVSHIPWQQKCWGGKHEVMARLDVPLYRRAGFSDEAAESSHRANQYYLGQPLSHTLRYRYKWHQNLAYGLTLQQDAGEPFACYRNYPYDYISAYVYYCTEDRKKRGWLGDFNVSWGQGLLMGNSFFNSAMATIEEASRQANRFRPHSSTEESRFFRGAALTLQCNDRWTVSAFVSLRQLDGRCVNDTLVSLKTDGLHRTYNENARKNQVNNYVVGARLNHDGRTGHWGVNAYWSHYDKVVYPKVHEYNRYALRGKEAAGVSMDYTWRYRKWQWMGESALDRSAHWAFSHILRYQSSPYLAFTIQQRSLSSRFVSPYGNTLYDGAMVQNEHGALFGFTLQSIRHLHLSAYVDYAWHPRPTYRACKASQKIEVALQSTYMASRRTHYTLSYKFRTRQENIAGHPGILQYVWNQRARLTAHYAGQKAAWTAAADLTAVSRQVSATTLGWMLSARWRYVMGHRLNFQTFGSLFFSDDYASRLYAYEPQLPYAAGFPSFAYHGCRMVGMFQWWFSSHSYAAVRYGWLHYFNRGVISSGPQQIDHSSQNDLGLQLAWRF